MFTLVSDHIVDCCAIFRETVLSGVTLRVILKCQQIVWVSDALENTSTKLATDYEAIRRREYELITDMLEVLPSIENLGEDRVSQLRDALFHADHPYLMVLVGPFSAGKSSLVNALLGGNTLLNVGPTPTTDRITILRWGEEAEKMSSGGDVDTVFHPSPLLKKVSLVDTPGLESIFRTHEETTRKFLHRSDTVLMVMLATQAMSAGNLDALKTLKQYGKNIIIAINQIDLISPEEIESVREYVQEQSQSKLGYRPQVWMVSAKTAREAQSGDELDRALWQQSGLNQLESYIDNQLGDVARLRQKLQTPLQIAQNVNQAALEVVRGNQAVLDKYNAIADNIDAQLAATKREQEKAVRASTETISQQFGEASARGAVAIQEVFKFSRALTSVVQGTLELVGLAGILRGAKGDMRLAFQERKAFEPIQSLPNTSDELAARLEGRDLQDLDDLVKYGQREIDKLPEGIRNKVIGTVQAPTAYDRTHMQEIRDDLEEIELEARTVETEKLEDALRNTLIYLAVYEILLLLFGIVLIAVLVQAPDTAPALLLVLVLALMLLGLVFVPLRGRMIENDYTERMLRLQARYIEVLTRAADAQIAYGMTLRKDAIAPLVRLIESQTDMQTAQLQKLQAAQQQMTDIETQLSNMGRNRLLSGLRNSL